ncbi:plasminogen activator, urokinase b [Xiphophorus couchianus]|uniref:plasminogen activator, urokinase b n=1 Tax=Xiphophorus couchianus TaxID=32473 RepID=UPI0010160C23|nr:urokinase-type plasminogen activator-like [Xiphophorus couchianus]
MQSLFGFHPLHSRTMINTRSPGVFLSLLIALPLAEVGQSRHGRRRNIGAFLPSSDSSNGICLNGGMSVPSLVTGEHLFCKCPDGFSGRHCETVIAKGDSCYEGIGLNYKGTVSKSVSGKTCKIWDLHTRDRYLSSDLHSGRHNYCRNIQYRLRPWCNVQKNHQLVQEYCDIPHCDVKSFTPAPSISPTMPQASAELTCGQRTIQRQTKIVGGTVSTVESHPWIAAIFWRSKSNQNVFRCGGSLISACWVITAAHCFPEGSQMRHQRFSVTLGKNAINESDPTVEQTFRVEQIFIHEQFNNTDQSYNNDIALMKLVANHGKCAEETNSVKTVCLPPPLQSLPPGITCEIAGYGKEKSGLWYNSQYLREAQVNLLADDVCQQKDYYGNMVNNNMFCAARPDWSQDACEGDSGGPLVCKVNNTLFLFGIISWGDGCAKENKPGVYTRVTNYNKWIEEKTNLSTITTGTMFPQK